MSYSGSYSRSGKRHAYVSESRRGLSRRPEVRGLSRRSVVGPALDASGRVPVGEWPDRLTWVSELPAGAVSVLQELACGVGEGRPVPESVAAAYRRSVGAAPGSPVATAALLEWLESRIARAVQSERDRRHHAANARQAAARVTRERLRRRVGHSERR